MAMLACLAGCGGQGSEGPHGFDSIVYSPTHATGFSISAVPGQRSVLITSSSPWQNADSDAVSRLLVLRGDEDIPSGFRGAVVRDRARRVVTMSTTQIAMLDAIGADDIVAGVSGLRFVSDSSVCARLTDDADVGYDGNIDYERLAALEPDLVLLYGVFGPSQMESKLDELGIPYFYIGDYVESTPLGKSEWTVAVGEIAGKRDSAERVFRNIVVSYDSLCASVAAVDSRPRVMVNMPYNGSWFMPSTKSYLVRMIEDAGGMLVYGDNNSGGSIPVDMETAYLLADSADVWINAGTATAMDEVLRALPKFADVRPMQTGQVFNSIARMTPGGGNDFYESGTVYPHRVLGDFIKIFHPELSRDSMYYYRQLH